MDLMGNFLRPSNEFDIFFCSILHSCAFICKWPWAKCMLSIEIQKKQKSMLR
jgi:hypothetical protein